MRKACVLLSVLGVLAFVAALVLGQYEAAVACTFLFALGVLGWLLLPTES